MPASSSCCCAEVISWLQSLLQELKQVPLQCWAKMKALLRVTSNIKAPAHSCFTDFTVLEKTVSGNASICLSHKKNSMKNWSKTTCQTNPVTQFANRPFLIFLIFTDTAQLILSLSLSHLIAWTQDIRFPITQEKLKVTFRVGFKLLELCTTAALSSLSPMGQKH